MSVKMLSLFAVAIIGIIHLGLGRRSESLSGNIFAGSTSSLGRYALALYSGLWASLPDIKSDAFGLSSMLGLRWMGSVLFRSRRNEQCFKRSPSCDTHLPTVGDRAVRHRQYL